MWFVVIFGWFVVVCGISMDRWLSGLKRVWMGLMIKELYVK